MESFKSLSRLFLLIGSYTFTTSNTCDIRTTNLHQEGYVSDIGSEYQPLLETINGASVTDCAIYVERKPSLQWFIFNSVDQVCITSTCWAMPVQLVPSSNNVLYRKSWWFCNIHFKMYQVAFWYTVRYLAVHVLLF